MLKEDLKFVFDQFQHDAKMKAYKELNSGHINSTFLIETTHKPYYVLQRINQNVFKNATDLIQNKVAVSEHLQQKINKTNAATATVLSFLKTKSNKAYYRDATGQCWNLMFYIEGSVTQSTVASKALAYKAGLLLGEFLCMTEDFDPNQLVEVIPKFHDISFRYSQFQEALKVANKSRLQHAEDLIAKINELKIEMHILQDLKESGQLKLRVTHNDTKISNMLFDANGKGICVIDTDTVMPGIIHYDFGDAIRTICTTAEEDETDLSKVEFNKVFYEAYSEGFLKHIKPSLSNFELQYLPLAAKTMIFIMGLRFLTDYLNNDVYYKIKYAVHNLDRAKNQFKLLDSFTKQMS
jgi:Ser/Thr protein kinase RdoA (MazF antagonist)